MALGQSQEISFVVGAFVFIGAIVFFCGLITADMSKDAIGYNSLATPPTPPADILGAIAYLPAIMGYFILTIFGLSSKYALITGCIVIPIIAGFAYLVAKLIRGN
jgi:hypothetical protein